MTILLLKIPPGLSETYDVPITFFPISATMNASSVFFVREETLPSTEPSACFLSRVPRLCYFRKQRGIVPVANAKPRVRAIMAATRYRILNGVDRALAMSHVPTPTVTRSVFPLAHSSVTPPDRRWIVRLHKTIHKTMRSLSGCVKMQFRCRTV